MPSSPTLIGFMSAVSAEFASQRAILPEHVFDAPRRLPRARLVFDQRDAHVVVAIVAEADARRHRHLGLGENLLCEFERTHAAVVLRYPGPDVHRGLGIVDHP